MANNALNLQRFYLLSLSKPLFMKKWLKRTLYTLLVLFLLFNAMIAMQAWQATRFYEAGTTKKHLQDMSFGEKANAAIFGVKVPKSIVTDTLILTHEYVYLTTKDSLQLVCWYVPAMGVIADKGPAAGTVIMFHGHGSNKSAMIDEARAFHSMNYNVLMVDLRAHGQSAGNVCTIGYRESRDIKAAWDYIAAKGEKNIVLWGISLGAATITKAMHDYAGIKPAKVILEMPFGTLQQAVRGAMRNNGVPAEPVSTLIAFWGSIERGFWAFGVNPEEYAKSIHCPVLLQRGAEDIRVTEEETQAIYKNIASPDKTLVEYEGCGHVSLCKYRHAQWEAAVEKFMFNK
jgi:alpha-beta hydrolase superfamily lysophospholipase